MSQRIFGPGKSPRSVRGSDGTDLLVPSDWALLAPGDAALTRRVKAAGEHWVVQEKKGRRTFSRGVWAPATTIERIRSELAAQRATEGFAKAKEARKRRRDKAQADYVDDFTDRVLAFLDFPTKYRCLAEQLARSVADHSTPIGSGTVARTQRIPVEQRAEAALIAWLRHQTTAYESMSIPRVKGKRRETRRLLAAKSKELLERYRRGEPIRPDCPLHEALMKQASDNQGDYLR